MDTNSPEKNIAPLKNADEKRFDDIFNQFSKLVPNCLLFSEYFTFCLDRNLLQREL
jgi:hypothetical protein